MASSILIYEDCFSKMTEAQVNAWRSITYSDLKKKHFFSRSSLLNMQGLPSSTFDSIEMSIKNQLAKLKSLGKLSLPRSTFVMIDSCILSRFTLPFIVSEVKQIPKLSNTNLILVFSQISMTENEYKLTFKSKYQSVRFQKLERNFKFIRGEEHFLMSNLAIIKTNLSFDSKILYLEECKFLLKNKTWAPKDRNEINDNAQLEMLLFLKRITSNKCCLVTNDKGLLLKAQNHDDLHTLNLVSKS